MRIMEKRFVCILIKFLYLLLIFGVANGQDDHGHDHGHDHGTATEVVSQKGLSPFLQTKAFFFEKELDQIRNGKTTDLTIGADSLTEIAEILLGRVNCSGRLDRVGDTCRECAELITNRIFVALEAENENSIDEEGFNKASVILLHTLSARNLRHECRNISDLRSVQDYVTTILGTGGTAGVMTMEDLESLLSGMKSDYQPSTYSKCFDAESLFKSALYNPNNGAKNDDLFKITTSLIAKFLEGLCIGHAQEVGPETFLEAVLGPFSADDFLGEMELDELMMQLSIGGDHSQHDHENEHDDHAHENDHRRRREVVRSFTHRQKRNDDSVENDDHAHEEHDHQDHAQSSTYDADTSSSDVLATSLHECYTSHQLFDLYGINHTVGVSKLTFPKICPSLIQQILSGACQQSGSDVNDDGRMEATLEVWLYGLLSVVIISCCSLFGGIILPFVSSDLYVTIVNTLVALAIAVMSGDALIHLLPMALGLHIHEAHDHHDHSDHGPLSSEFEYVWKCTVAMGTIYIFFLFEMIVEFMNDHNHSHCVDSSKMVVVNSGDQELQSINHPTTRVLPTHQEDSLHNGDTPEVDNKKAIYAFESGISAEQITADEISSQFVSGEERNGLKTKTAVEPETSRKGWICFQNGSLPIMVVVGDGLHNFGDGMAIGASFLAGLGPGLSTSLAVFCHELPHELGDLAVLLKSGVSLKWALFVNFLSALTCVAGLVVGILFGVTLAARQWIFATTAGTFLYIALADMLPRVIRVKETANPRLMFLLINVGFFVGMGLILMIALYEDAIVLNV